MTDNAERLNIPGARGTVEITGARGIFFTVAIDGEPVKRRRGVWPIPLRRGVTGELRSRGLIPGFAKLYLDGEFVYDMGAGVSKPERVLMFVPLVLVVFGLWGLPLALLLFFMNIGVIKNTAMPRAMRIALPLINTLAGAAILALLLGLLG